MPSLLSAQSSNDLANTDAPLACLNDNGTGNDDEGG